MEKIKVYALCEELEREVLSNGEIDGFRGVNAYVGENMRDLYVSDEEGSYIELPSFPENTISENDLVDKSFESASTTLY